MIISLQKFADSASKLRNKKSKKKRKKPLRQKRIKPIIICFKCRAKLDPNSNLSRTEFRYLCNKCYKKLYFICLRCCQKKLRLSRSPKNNRLCKRCVRDMTELRLFSNHRPMPTEEVRWDRGSRIHGSTFDLIGSTRTFGIEIETAACRFAERLENKISFGAKFDATCSGREFVSPILSGNEGLYAICDFCDHAKRRGWSVDKKCGVHIHLGMQNEEIDTVKRIAVAYLHTYPSWAKLVDPVRLLNEYCCPPSTTAQALALHNDFRYYCDGVNRYQFFNFAAFMEHGTIEIRGLEGTLDKTLISNWIIAHLSFTDFAANSSYEELEALFDGAEEKNWQNLKQYIGSTARYFGRVRAKRIREKAQV